MIRDPIETAGEPYGQCDCCGEYRHVTFVNGGWLCGETWACEECRGIEPDEDDNDQLQFEHEMRGP
jgi:hypothetical protein